MKVQKFYPKQVMRRLKGRRVETLDKGEQAALYFFMRKSRPYKWAIAVITQRDDFLEVAQGKPGKPSTILLNEG